MKAQKTHLSQQKGFSLIELLIVVVIIAIIAVIAIPNLLQARRASNESSAIASVSLIYRSQMTYKTTSGNGEFTDLTTLYNQHFIDTTLGSAPNTKSGYHFEMDVFASSPGVDARFDLRGRPVIHSLTNFLTGTGSRDFGINETGGIFETSDNTPVTFDGTTRLPLGTAVQIDR